MTKEIHKIPKEGRMEEFYVLSTEWYEENVILTVLDNDTTWTGETDSVKITEFCDALHKTKENFMKELKSALTENEKEFTFLMEEDNFIVKKVDLKSNIKVKFCSIPLKRASSIPVFMNILSELLDQDKINKKTMSKLSHDVKDLKAELKICKEKLLHFASEKASLETILYSKFCEILNAKKRKIAELESSIGECSRSSPSEGTSRISEHEKISSNVTVKETNTTNPSRPKRKCLEEAVSEELSQEASNITTLQGESVLDNENSNHYDSDTEVETDDDSVVSNSAVIKTSDCDISERTSQRILPKRTFSNSILPKRTTGSILPKRISNDSVIIKNQEKTNALPQPNLMEVEEFNSQSLLDEY